MLIYSYSVIRSSTKEFLDRVPYCIAILETEDGCRFVSFLEGYADHMGIKIGQKVKYLGMDENGKDRYSL